MEIHYHIGLKEEAKNMQIFLGYNYNSSEWFEQSYKILNKDYKILKVENIETNNRKTFYKRLLK